MGEAHARAAGACGLPQSASAVLQGFAVCSRPAVHTYEFTWAMKTIPRGEAGGTWAPRRCQGIAVPAAKPALGCSRRGPSVPHAVAGERGDVVAAWEKRRHMLVES